MSREWWLLLILLILNLLIVITYLVWNLLIRYRENKPAVIMKAAVMLLCPVIGPLFLILSFLFYKLFMGQSMDLEDVIFNKEKVETFMHPDEDMERNMVSIEEALAVTDKGNLRTLMMNVIRGDYSQSLSGFLMALNSDDSETAHYAASVLQEVLNGFRVNVQRMYKAALEEDEGQKQRCVELIEYMNPILEQHVLTEIEQRSMTERMDETGDLLFALDQYGIGRHIYEILSMRNLEAGQTINCQKWCDRGAAAYPDTLVSYKCRLKLYFETKNRTAFFAVLNDLKQSEIMIDSETLEMVRIFM